MRFVCLGYLDAERWERMTEAERQSMIDTCSEYDLELQRGHHIAGGECLHSGASAKTLRWQDGKTVVTDGPYAETREQLGGILILEAEDMNEAVQLMSRHPGVRLGGPFEIRPAADKPSDLIPAREAPNETAAHGVQTHKDACKQSS